MNFLIMQPWISYRGAETMSVSFARELAKQGNPTKILGLFVERQDQKGLEFILPPRSLQKIFQKNTFLCYVLGAPYLFYLVLANVRKFDILVPYNLPTSWIAVAVGKVYKKPVIWMSQGIPEKAVNMDEKSLIEYILWNIAASRLDIFLTRRIDKIITPSNYMAGKILARYSKKAVVIQNPTALIGGEVNNLPRPVKELRKNNKFVFLQVGAFHAQKRQLETIEVFSKILKKEPRCALIFVGEGHLKNAILRRVHTLGLHSKIYIQGYVPKTKIGAFYKICDLNLLPSISETFGATPLEALKYGKNSLVTNDSGIKEAVSGYAIVSGTDTRSLYENLLKYIKNKKYYDNMAIKNKRILKKLPNWPQYTKRILKEINFDPIDTYKTAYYDTHYHKATQDLLNERETRTKRALKYLDIKKGEKILDLGVGEGDLAYEMSKMGAKVIGIDYSADAIKLARKRCGKKVRLYKMDAEKLNFPDKFFDKVVSVDVFEHIYPQKLEKALKEVKRVTKKGGILVAETSPNTFFWFPVLYMGKLLFNMKNLESEKYHINLFNYFRLRKTLSEVSDDVFVTLHNDGKNFLSSRVIGSNLTGKNKFRKLIFNILRVTDILGENKFCRFVIRNTFLNIFLGHDLWSIAKF